MFRVVQDQLRVSDGWVRCGRCDHVFNALDALVDLEAEAAHAAESVDAWHAGSVEAEPEPETPQSEPELQVASTAGADFPALTPFAGLSQPEHQDHWIEHDPAASAGDATTISVEALGQQGAYSGDASPSAALVQPLPAAPAARGAPAATPGFMRQAERDSRWTSPAMRAAFSGAVLMLLAVLAMQVIYHFRDEVAARSASAAHLLRSACARWNCSIELPRRLHEVTLESHTLSRVAQQPQAVKLAISLRNRGRTDLALPAIDLSLTDASGQLIARRALLPRDFHIDRPLIERGAELPLEVVLSTGKQSITGYTVELFYP